MVREHGNSQIPGSVPRRPDSVGLGAGLRICISQKPPVTLMTPIMVALMSSTA